MSGRAAELAQRRLVLQERCARQRGELGVTSRTLERQLGLVDHGLTLIRGVASAPVLVAAGVAFVFLIRPRRLFRWAGNILILAAAYKRLTRD